MNKDTIIDSLELVRLTGPYKSTPGANRSTSKKALVTSNGVIKLRQHPGFGIEFDDAKIEKQDLLVKV